MAGRWKIFLRNCRRCTPRRSRVGRRRCRNCPCDTATTRCGSVVRLTAVRFKRRGSLGASATVTAFGFRREGVPNRSDLRQVVQTKGGAPHETNRPTRNPEIVLADHNGEITLYIDGNQAMQAWEHDLMVELADLLCQYGCEFLEVGLWLGISALRIEQNNM